MNRDEQAAWDSYATNLQASMNRHPAGKQLRPELQRAVMGYQYPTGVPDVLRAPEDTPIYDSIVLGDYEYHRARWLERFVRIVNGSGTPRGWQRFKRSAAATYALFTLALILLWVLA